MIATGFVERGRQGLHQQPQGGGASSAAADEIGATPLPADLSTEAGAWRSREASPSGSPSSTCSSTTPVRRGARRWPEYPDSAFDKVFSTNVKGPFHLTRALLPQLEAAVDRGDPARVIMIGSIEGIRCRSWENYAYPASKAAIHMLTRQLAAKLAPEHHRQRHRPRTLREQDDGLRLR